MKKVRGYIKKIMGIAAAFVVAMVGLLYQTVAPVGITIAEDTATKVHSAVMDDLKKDSNFNEANYPSVADDHSLQVIQIAESSDGELFVYVYQPCNDTLDLVASSINISQNMEGDDPESYHNYNLTLLSTQGVFDKYRVEGITLKEDVLRYYSITAIYRAFNGDIDEGSTDDNTIEQVAYAVGQLWTATTYQGSPIYSVRYLELITVETKHVGYIRYSDGGLFFQKSTNSHYVAFSTDRQIDDLLEVEMSYTVQDKSSVTITQLGTPKTTVSDKGDPVKYDIVLTKEDVFKSLGGGIFSEYYEYNRIQAIDDFRANEDLTDDTLSALQGQEWVLRFCETENSTSVSSSGEGIGYTQTEITTYSVVTSVVLFRLEYEYDGQIYNLGVVDNISRGDLIPDNNPPDLGEIIDDIFPETEFFENIFGENSGIPTWLKVVILVIVVIIAAVVVLFLLPYIVQGVILLIPKILNGLWALLKGVGYVIASPVLLVIWIVKKVRGDYD
ncbi:MAG: hypothetical protein IJ514_03080 [Clostridia bacterium]|nr:hypothetical protein [Clostridia bacterium]